MCDNIFQTLGQKRALRHNKTMTDQNHRPCGIKYPKLESKSVFDTLTAIEKTIIVISGAFSVIVCFFALAGFAL